MDAQNMLTTPAVTRVQSVFPNVTSKDLAGRTLFLPRDFPGMKTVVIVAFEREQQHEVDGWIAGLGLEGGKIPWLELPVIENPGAIGRWFIDNGMRRGINNRETWRHVVTLYTDKSSFKAAVGIPTESAVYAMVVDQKGIVLRTVSGPFTKLGGEVIAQELDLPIGANQGPVSAIGKQDNYNRSINKVE